MIHPFDINHLLTPGERQGLADRRIQKGWTALPADPQAAAQHFFATLPLAEQERRRAQYRAGQPITAAPRGR